MRHLGTRPTWRRRPQCRGLDTRLYACLPYCLVEQTRRAGIIPQLPHRTCMKSSVPLQKFSLFFLQTLQRFYDFPAGRCHTFNCAWGTREGLSRGGRFGEGPTSHARWSALLGHTVQSTVVYPRIAGSACHGEHSPARTCVLTRRPYSTRSNVGRTCVPHSTVSSTDVA